MEPKFYIGVDAYDDVFAFCLVRRVKGFTDIILYDKSKDEKEFTETVNNLAKYFNSTVYSSIGEVRLLLM